MSEQETPETEAPEPERAGPRSSPPRRGTEDNEEEVMGWTGTRS